MKQHVNHALSSFIDWIFRRKHPARLLVLAGVGLLTVVVGGLALDIRFSSGTKSASLSFTTDAGGAAALTYLVAGLGAVLVVVGLWWLVADWRQESRKRVLVLEFRGLRDWRGAPLSEAVPAQIEGRRESRVVNLRQGVLDGVIVDPQAAIDRLMPLRRELDLVEEGYDRRDVRYVAGGLAPVPMMFLAGVLIDDEGPVTLLDWDRQAQIWRPLIGDDDGERFEVSGIDTLVPELDAVILAVSVSYLVDLPAAHSRVGMLPAVQLRCPSLTTDNHWSEEKQTALAQQFIDALIAIKSAGIQRVHLFMAGPNSVVLRFGMNYDKRNFPLVTVYQYEPGTPSTFSWGIIMPVAGASQAAMTTP
jgi:hypothetical protein